MREIDVDYNFVSRVIKNKDNSTLEHMNGISNLIKLFAAKHGKNKEYHFLCMTAYDSLGSFWFFDHKLSKDYWF